VKEAPEGEAWLHEMKYDGYRMLCRIERSNARVYSRNGKEWTAAFAAIARAAACLPVESAWIDGEIVVMDAQGRSSFQALQNALSEQSGDRLHYYAFDLPYLNSFDLREVPLVERKRVLEKILAGAGVFRYSSHVQGSGIAFYQQACKHGLEGIIAKRADSHYVAGRTRTWLKVKCAQRQEMVIGGYSDPEGSRTGFGALLLGVYEPGGGLRYSGKVGTGFNEQILASLKQKLDRLVQKEPPFINPPKGAEARRAHWVKPQLVAEIAFTEWTDDGTLRHPSFQGLREDKNPTEVIRERATDIVKPDPEATKRAQQTVRPSADAPKRGSSAGGKSGDTIAAIKLTNPTKLFYPEAKLAKRDLAAYYEAIGEWIVPHLRNRPLTLVRCPNGWDKPCFHQKHAAQHTNKAIDRVRIQGKDGPTLYMMANSVSAVVALVQLGVLELHPWGSRAKKLHSPDRIILDLDPDDDVAWDQLVEATQLVKALLEQIGLQGFLKTTGGKGLHVVIPIEPTLRWDAIKGFTKAIAEVLTRTFPDRFTAKLSKATRTGKIFIDYLRNAEEATAIAAYSARARANAPVSTPIGWAELAEDVRFDHFNVRNVPARLKNLRKDPWAEFFNVRQTVTNPMLKTVGYGKP